MDGEGRAKIEARCPECGQWSEVSFYEVDGYSGIWWSTSGPCPQCGKAIMAEELKTRSINGYKVINCKKLNI